MTEPPLWLTTQELADRWRTAPETIRYHRHIGKGVRGVKFGRKVLYRLSDIEAYEALVMAGGAA